MPKCGLGAMLGNNNNSRDVHNNHTNYTCDSCCGGIRDFSTF